MRKLPLAIAGGFLLLFGLAAMPAFADCANDIKALEQKLSSLQEEGRGHKKANAERLIAEAKKALAEGKMEMCQKKVENATKLAEKIK